MKLGKIILTILIIAVNVLVTSAQEDPTSMFTMLEDPIFQRGESDEWDDTYNEPGAIIFHDGQFHMFRNGVSGWPSPGATGYLTSDDGLTWIEDNEESFFSTTEIPYVKVSKHNYTMLVEDDGTWVIYFFAYQDGGVVNQRIGRATASKPIGPWIADEDFVLDVGEAGEWDDAGISGPSVIKTEDGQYLMFYSGRTGNNSAIGLATSEDGIAWTKYNDPATIEAPYADSDPIFVGEMADEKRWEFNHVNWPHVIVGEGNRLEMFYRGGSGSIGLAFSDNGLTWERYVNNPVLTAEDVVTGTNIGSFNVINQDDIYYLYIESRVPEGGTKVFVATYNGEFAQE